MNALIDKVKSVFNNKDDNQIKAERGYNPNLIAQIQSQGGISFKNGSYLKMGDGYLACVHVYKYQSTVNDFWLEQLMSIENTLVTLDMTTPNKKEIIEEINKAMSEQDNRYANAKDNIDRIDARSNYQELDELYNAITEGEMMKRILLRAFVMGKTLEELETNVQSVIEELESYNFRGAVLINEQEWEWESLFTSYTNQQEYMNNRKGKEIPSTTIAGGYPFHYTHLSDEKGTYYGTTDTGGSVIFDMFHKDNQRKYYNALMIGKMGSGKSTMLKKVVLDNAIKGDKVRVLDVTGEFRGLINQLGGKEVALDGSEGIINALQVFKTVTNDDGSTNINSSFTQHISKMSILYSFLSGNPDDSELKEFKVLLRKLYIKMGLWSEEETINITEFSAEEYPTFSDLLNLVQEELYENKKEKIIRNNLSEYRSNRLENIELTLDDVVSNYGDIFDGISSIENFDEELVVSFPLRNLTNLEDRIFQAQTFSIMNLLWDGMISNGSPQFDAFNKGELEFDEAMKYLIIIDEAHHLINTDDISQPAVNFLVKFMREARKYFGGLFFASHLITDFVPEGSKSENAENVKNLFRLTQYKFIAEQDAESTEKLRTVFDGQLTDSELKVIPKLQTGSTILAISGVKNITFDVDVSPSELSLFGGGA